MGLASRDERFFPIPYQITVLSRGHTRQSKHVWRPRFSWASLEHLPICVVLIKMSNSFLQVPIFRYEFINNTGGQILSF